MELHSLKPAKGSVKTRKRVGRGEGSGLGGTSTRGHKGDKSRSGYSKKFGFEGGQMPLYKRIPKFGFKNFNRVEYQPINLSTIELLSKKQNISEITPEVLYNNGLIGKNDLVKILGTGDITNKINVIAHAFSKTAKQKIEEKGGTTQIISIK